jgi:putative ABC transport system permease protein
MTWWRELLLQTLFNVWSHKLRSALTMFGVAWGAASIMIMMAIGDGFKIGYLQSLSTLGTDIAIVWGGRTRGQAGDQRAGRRIRLTTEDVEAIRSSCHLVAAATPELERVLRISSPHNAGRFSTHGVAPVYQQIRSMRVASGRPMTEEDNQQEWRVCVVGPEVRKQLFGDRPAVGAQVRIQDMPFTIIGELAKKDQNSSYNGFDANKVLVPHRTMARHFPNPQAFEGAGAIDTLVFMPRTAVDHERALRQVKVVLGRRHGFDPDDEGALWVWDTVREARMVSSLYDSMQRFLAFVAVITLGLGGVGVMNIMLVAVAERTREIGIKKAIGATPGQILGEFFLESILLTFSSGGLGVAVAWCVSAGVSRLPLPQMFAGLPITPWTAAITFLTLTLVGVSAAVYPARRAAGLAPVDALRYE